MATCKEEAALLFPQDSKLSGSYPTLQLFLYGTYLPHHPPKGPNANTAVMAWPKSRTSQASRLQSFLTCYHFDLVGMHGFHEQVAEAGVGFSC
jgi:hypothetical protein